ncbi:hypothetical protein ACHAXR_002816 [Thalassiosira sp. AJA248-18]
MAKITPLVWAIILPSVVSFAPSGSIYYGSSLGSRCVGPSSSALSSANADIENSSDLSHQVTPLPTQPLSSPFSSLLKPGAVDWKEWQYSFSRNGLTDFLPQFSSHIDFLSIDISTMEGQDPATAISSAIESSSSARLPWQYEDDDSKAVTSSITATNIPVSTSLANTSASRSSTTDIDDKNVFDCILDGGVMNGIVSSLPSTVTWHSRTGPAALLDLVKLMQEANQSIREFGIYVAITETSIPDHAKGYLDAMGEVMGLEWNYDLDGLTNKDYSVSVARKYDAGAVNLDPFTGGTGSDVKNLLKP